MRSRRPPHSPVHDVFGYAVRETRARRGLSQEELGFQAKLHRNYIGAIERGEINPTLRVILNLSKGLQVRPSELAELTERRWAELSNGLPVWPFQLAELRWEPIRNANDSAGPFDEPKTLGRRRRR